MWAQSVCNLLNTLCMPPWTTPLDWSLHITFNGEERIPFHIYVQCGSVQPYSSSQISSFPGFQRLPTELQLRILALCTAPSLIQTMRIPMLRVECEKLFRADPNTYYLIEAHWLFKGGRLGHTSYDLSFMHYAQNIEIEYDVCSDDTIGPIRDDVLEIDHEKAQEFWKTFRSRFPRAKRVVVNQNWESSSIRYLDDEPVTCCLKVLIESCPVELDVLAFVLMEVGSGGSRRTALPAPTNWHRKLYRLDDDGVWNDVTTTQCERKTILMPPKRFKGPLGDCKALRYQCERILLHKEALRLLQLKPLIDTISIRRSPSRSIALYPDVMSTSRKQGSGRCMQQMRIILTCSQSHALTFYLRN